LPASHFDCVAGGAAGSIADTNDPTQLSTVASAVEVSSKVMQSFGFLFSSFSKQPLVGSAPPSNLATTLSSHPKALGSFDLPGVSDDW
jgi:hypothetical protein